METSFVSKYTENAKIKGFDCNDWFNGISLLQAEIGGEGDGNVEDAGEELQKIQSFCKYFFFNINRYKIISHNHLIQHDCAT